MKNRDTSILDIDFNDEFETPRDGVGLSVQKSNLFRLIFQKDIEGLVAQ